MQIHYQPIKMFCWRIATLFLFGSFLIFKDYQYYRFSFDLWFTWIPLFIIAAGILTINFQSACLGSMSYQYRHHDASFQIAKQFTDFAYSPLLNGLGHKLSALKGACYQAKTALLFLLIGGLLLIGLKAFIFQFVGSSRGYFLVSIFYALIMLILALATLVNVLYIVSRNRQTELLELSLFWLTNASKLKYIKQLDDETDIVSEDSAFC